MRGKVIHLDKDQLKLIELIDIWLRESITNDIKDYHQNRTIMDSRTFLTLLYEKGWYREGSEDQTLLKELRTQWIENGGKWKPS
jgi:hypothetical protein